MKTSKIICVRLDSPGDVIMTTPAFGVIRRSYPNAHLTLLTSPASMVLSPHLAMFDEVLSFEAPWVKQRSKQNLNKSLSKSLKQQLGQIESKAFDKAFIFSVYSQSALPAALFLTQAGIQERIGFSRENPYDLLTHWVREEEPEKLVRHEVQRQLHLLTTYGLDVSKAQMNLSRASEDANSLSNLLHSHSVYPGSYVVMHPGATASSRRYPERKWGEVARRVWERIKVPIVVTGLLEERSQIEEMIRTAAPARVINFCGQLTFGQYIELIAQAELLVSVNTSAVHVASAVGTPVVVLYALTNPQHTPWRVPHLVLSKKVPCAYCYKSVCSRGENVCISDLSPELISDSTVRLYELNRKQKEELWPSPFKQLISGLH